MKLFNIFVLSAAVVAATTTDAGSDTDSLGHKNPNKGKEKPSKGEKPKKESGKPKPDKPEKPAKPEKPGKVKVSRDCNGDELGEFWKCKSVKTGDLSKGCKLKCKKGKEQGETKVYCSASQGWADKKGEKKLTPGTCA